MAWQQGGVNAGRAARCSRGWQGGASGIFKAVVKADKAMRQGVGWHGSKAEQQGKVKANMAARLKARREARHSQGWQRRSEEQSRHGSTVEAGRVML